jgi:hypothetical protein
VKDLESTYSVISDALKVGDWAVHTAKDQAVVIIRARHGDAIAYVTQAEAFPLLPMDLVALVTDRLAAPPA